MHVTKAKYARPTGNHNINLLTPYGRRPVNVNLVKIVYLCFHCLGRLKFYNSGVQCEQNSNHYGFIHRDEAGRMTDEERFMKLSDMFPSEYFRGIDIGKPTIFTIKAVVAEQAKNFITGESKVEWIMKFNETPKKLRLNLTMVKACALFLEDTDNPDEIDPENWVGKRVTIYRTITKVKKEDHIVPRIRRPESGDVDLAKAIKQAQPKGKAGNSNGKPDTEAWKAFLARMKEEFDLDEAGVKSKLKELKYSGFTSAKAEEMYESIKVLMSQEAAAEIEEAEQSGLFEEDEPADLSDELKAALAGAEDF